jgi:di/tricarboxylate transporter
MTSQQWRLVFMVACAVTVLLVIIGILYLAGAVIVTISHNRRAEACFAAAVVAAIVAVVARPRAALAR